MKKQFSIDEITNLLRGLTNENFYGSLELQLQSGRIVHCKKIESIKPLSCIEAIELLESST